MTDRNINELKKNETIQEDYSRFSDNGRMEKEPAVDIFLEILLNKRLDEVDAFIEVNRNIIDAREKALYIYLIVLYDGYSVLHKIVEVIDEQAAYLKGIDSLKVFEMPENIDSMFEETPEKDDLRRSAFQEAIAMRRKLPIIEIMKLEGNKITLNDDDIVNLGMIDNDLLYHAVENRLRIKRK